MRYVLPLATLLLSCSAASQSPFSGRYPAGAGSVPSIQPVAASPASTQGGAVSNYAGQGDGSLISVKLSSLPNGRVRALGGLSGTGGGFCAGSFSGTGVLRGNALVVADETVPGCRVTLTHAGRQLTVAEGPQCLPLHGPSCGFSGMLAQQ